MNSMTAPVRFAQALRSTLFSLVVALALPTPARADTVRLGGTGAALGTMALLAQAYKKVDPTFQLEIVANLGSNGGIKALTSGATQIAVVSRAIKAEDLAAGLLAVEYGRTAFVLATAKDTVQGLTLAQITDLYAGRQTDRKSTRLNSSHG